MDPGPRFSFFVTCPFGTENVAWSDLHRVLSRYRPAIAMDSSSNPCPLPRSNDTCPASSNWYEIESVKNCWTRAHGPPLPPSFLSVAFGAKGGIVGNPKRRHVAAAAGEPTKARGDKRVVAASDAHDTQYQCTTDTTDQVIAVRNDAAGGRKRQRASESGMTDQKQEAEAGEGILKGLACSSSNSRSTRLSSEKIEALNFVALTQGDNEVGAQDEKEVGEKGTRAAKLSCFRGTVTFTFRIPMDAPLVLITRNKKDEDKDKDFTSRTPRRVLLEDIYFLRSVMGVYVHLAEDPASSGCDEEQGADANTDNEGHNAYANSISTQHAVRPPLVRYDPYSTVTAQQELVDFVHKKLFTRARKQSSACDAFCGGFVAFPPVMSRWDEIVEEVNAVRSAVVSACASKTLADVTRPLLLTNLSTPPILNENEIVSPPPQEHREESGETKPSSSPSPLVLFRVSCTRFDKSQSDGQAASSSGYAAKERSGKKEGAEPQTKPSQTFVKAASVDIERFLGGLIGEQLCPETEDSVQELLDASEGVGVGGEVEPACSRSFLPLPLRPHRASMLYHNIEVKCLHDFDRVVLGIALHDANPPRVDTVAGADRPFAETTGAALEERNATRRQVVANLLPSTLTARHAYVRLTSPGGAAAVDSMSSTDIQNKQKASPLFTSYRQPTSARPSSFKHDVRMSKGDNSMNPALASMMSWYLLSWRKTSATAEEGRIDTDKSCSPYSNPILSYPYAFVDPLGGTGTTIIEGYLRHSSYPLVGFSGDLRLSEAKAMSSNFKEENLASQMAAIGLSALSVRSKSTGLQSSTQPSPFIATACHWDATRMPFQDSSVDGILSDLPFGRRCGSASLNDQLYVQLLIEFHRVLRTPPPRCVSSSEDSREGSSNKSSRDMDHTCIEHASNFPPHRGRCVLLTIERKLMVTALVEAAVKGSPFRVLQRPFMVDMGGLMPYVFVLEKG